VEEVGQAAKDAMRMLRVRGGGPPRQQLSQTDWRAVMGDGGLNEAETRVMVDAICRPVLRVTSKVTAMERGFHGNSVATNVPDYTLYDSVTGKIIGVIEAKRSGGDLQHAVRQMVLQLITLQGAKDQVVQTRPLVGIATDAYRWAFIFLERDRWHVVHHPAAVMYAVEGDHGGTRHLEALVSTLYWAMELHGFAATDSPAPRPAMPLLPAPDCGRNSNPDAPVLSGSQGARDRRRRRGVQRTALRFHCTRGAAEFDRLLRRVVRKTPGCTVFVDGGTTRVYCYVRKMAVVWWRILRMLQTDMLGNKSCTVTTLDVGGIPCPENLDISSKVAMYAWLCDARKKPHPVAS
jgi:hypothetical protein